MDDECARECHVDQPGPEEVEWHLIGHSRRLGGDRAQHTEIVCRRLGQELRDLMLRGNERRLVPVRVRAVPLRPALVPEMQLGAGPDLRMHGDDLLDQSCAGPRHADDQHRGRIGAAEFGRPRNPFGCTPGNQAVGLGGERGRVEPHSAMAHRVCGVEMLHGQGVVAKILRRLADREVNPQALHRFQSRRGQGGLHRLKQTVVVVIARDRAAPDQFVVASRQHRRDRDRAFEACTSLVETAELSEQIAQQIISHGVPRIGHQRLSQYLFGFLIAILGQQRPRLAKAAEAVPISGRCRAPETADRLVAMAQRIEQGAGAEPRLSQGWEQFRGAVVRNDRPADVAHLLQGDSQAEMCIGIARVAGDGPLQYRDGIRYAADLEAGEAEIVLDDGIGRLQQCCIAQRRDRIGGSPGPEKLTGQRKQRRHLLRRGRVWRLGHGANLPWKL